MDLFFSFLLLESISDYLDEDERLFLIFMVKILRFSQVVSLFGFPAKSGTNFGGNGPSIMKINVICSEQRGFLYFFKDKFNGDPFLALSYQIVWLAIIKTRKHVLSSLRDVLESMTLVTAAFWSFVFNLQLFWMIWWNY